MLRKAKKPSRGSTLLESKKGSANAQVLVRASPTAQDAPGPHCQPHQPHVANRTSPAWQKTPDPRNYLHAQPNQRLDFKTLKGPILAHVETQMKPFGSPAGAIWAHWVAFAGFLKFLAGFAVPTGAPRDPTEAPEGLWTPKSSSLGPLGAHKDPKTAPRTLRKGILKQPLGKTECTETFFKYILSPIAPPLGRAKPLKHA